MRAEVYETGQIRVPYEFQRGGNVLLRVKKVITAAAMTTAKSRRSLCQPCREPSIPGGIAFSPRRGGCGITIRKERCCFEQEHGACEAGLPIPAGLDVPIEKGAIRRCSPGKRCGTTPWSACEDQSRSRVRLFFRTIICGGIGLRLFGRDWLVIVVGHGLHARQAQVFILLRLHLLRRLV